MKDIDDNNNFFIMINSGSKGKKINAMQIMGVLGQDNFKQARIAKEVNEEHYLTSLEMMILLLLVDIFKILI